MSHLEAVLTVIGGMLAGFAAAIPLVWHQRARTGRWRYLATHDEVTGLPNRRAVTAHLAAATTHGRPPALILIDLDHFKQVNDTYGHEAGNDLLRAVADRLDTLAAPATLVGRLSGDEFVVVVDGDLEATGTVAHDAWAAVSGLPYRIDGDLVEVSASVGYAVARLGVTPRQLLRRADRAMYVAKQAGRGRVHGELLANYEPADSCARPSRRYRDERDLP